jgi:NADH-quinone oxidoreductase subunit G
VRNAPLDLVDALKIPRWNDRAVRDVIQHRCGPLHLAVLAPTKLDEIATTTRFAAPDDLARIGFAIAHELDASAPGVTGLPTVQQHFVRRAAADLRAAKRPLVIAGASLGSIGLVRAAANVARALDPGGDKPVLSLVVPEANTLGVSLLESVPLAELHDAETLIVLENDLFRRLPNDEVKAFLNGAKHIIALDALENPTTRVAHTALPAGTFAESDGSFINQEGRAQRYFQVIAPSGEVQESWRWLRDLMIAGGQLPPGSWIELDDVLADLAIEHPALAGVKDAAPSAVTGKWARSSRRFSGRTSILAHLSVHEPKPPDDPDAPLSFTMEGSAESPPPALLNRYWSPGWNSVQALNQFQQEVGGPLRGGDPGVLLFEGKGESAWFESIPPAFTPPGNGLLAVPMHHIFGSEELSRLAPAIAERIPSPYLALNAAEAAKHALDGEIAFTLGTTGYRLPLRIVPELPDGVAGFSAGFPETAGIEPNQLIPI